MTFWERFKSLFVRDLPEPDDKQERADWVYREPRPHIIFPVKSGAVVNEDTAVSWTAIWRAIDLVSSAIASMPFTIIEEDDTGNIRTLKRHPLWTMINVEPHPLYSTFDFLRAVMYNRLLRGNAIIVINRIGTGGGSNRPGTLRVVPFSDVYDIREDEETETVWYRIKGYPDRIAHNDVIHIKGLTRNGLWGLDTLTYNREAFGMALSSSDTSAASYKHGIKSDGFLSTEQQIDPQRRKDIQDAWNAKTRAGETPLLTGGIKWQAIGITPKELQLLEGRQFNVYEAARIIGVSPHLLFAMDRANFSNVETLSLEFAKYTLRFHAESIEQEFSRKIFRGTEKGRIKVNLNMDAFLRGDTETRAKYIEGLVDRGVLSIDEARRIEGFNSLGDVGNTHMVPLNFQTLEQMKAGASDPDNTNENAPDDVSRKAKLNGHAPAKNLN